MGALAAAIVVALGVAPAAAQNARTPTGAVPYKAAPPAPLDFRGPGRELPEPLVSEVVLGWFGPDDPDHPDFGELWRGARLALDEENRSGGYGAGKLPFRLVAAWSESPWQAGIRGVARLVEEQGAWAVVGGVDGATTHLAVQLALKAHFLLLSPGSSDVTADRANVPWLFSLPPSDEQMAPVLAAAVARGARGGGFVVAAATDHDSHAALVAARRALATRQLVPSALVELAPLLDDPSLVATRLLESQPRVVLLLAGSRPAGRLVAALRKAGFTGTIVGGAPLSRSAFRRAAGEAAQGVLAPTAISASGEAFARAYVARWGEPPDDGAVRSYDAVRLTVAAIRKAGLNRARIRDAVRALAPWQGAAGAVRWDARGRNEPPVALGVWTQGRLSVVEPD